MQKQIVSLSALALMILVTGCVKNEATPDIAGGSNINTEHISFRSSTGKTRNDNGIIEVGTGFNVIGLKADGGYIPGFAAPDYDDAQTYWNNSGVWEWLSPPAGDDKKWPTVNEDYPLNFFAAFPMDHTINAATPTLEMYQHPNVWDQNDTFHYNIFNTSKIPYVTGGHMNDFLAAQATVATRPAQGFTDLTFKHITSQPAFDIVVPAGFEANIQSIVIANVMYQGRAYNYSNSTLGTVSAQNDDNTGSFAHCHEVGSTPNKYQTITSAKPTVYAAINTIPGADYGDNVTLKLMPQTATTPWDLTTFTTNVAAWKGGSFATPADAITAWHESDVASGGMKESEGWKGSRIEVIYNLIDVTNGKNIVGRKKGVDGAAADQFVRVGYMLDLSTIDTKGDASLMGLHPGYKYKFQIPLGTADATNGVLLDPDYKDETGGNTNTPVDNPVVVPGDPITKEGVISFKVAVDEWADYTGDIK